MEKNPYLKIIIAAIIWGSSGVFIKKINLQAEVIAFFRLAVPSIFFLIIYFFKKEKIRFSKLLLLASLLNAIRLFFYFEGYTLTSISNAVIILYTWPIFATFFSFIFLKEKISKIQIIAIFIAFAGIILIYFNQTISFTNKDLLGMSSILLSSIIYAITVVIYKFKSHNFTNKDLIIYQNFLGSIIFFPFLLKSFNSINSYQISLSIIYAFLIGVVGFFLFFSSLKEIKASTSSQLTYFEVVSGIIFAIIFFKEELSLRLIIGGIMIILPGLILAKKSD